MKKETPSTIFANVFPFANSGKHVEIMSTKRLIASDFTGTGGRWMPPLETNIGRGVFRGGGYNSLVFPCLRVWRRFSHGGFVVLVFLVWPWFRSFRGGFVFSVWPLDSYSDHFFKTTMF